jgi:hypothetical protein
MQEQVQSLFDDPISQLFQALENLKIDKEIVKEFEKDYPIELEDLIRGAKQMQKQIKELKEKFALELQKNKDYLLARERKANSKIKADELKAQIYQKAFTLEEDLDCTIIVKGAPVRLQSQNQKMLYLNGKEL